jgi:hypothetical protein
MANNPEEEEHPQPKPSAEPDGDVWWENYIRQVDESVVKAEQHLEVPAGTISSIWRDPDFIATVKAYAVVEPIVNQLIASCLPQVPVLGLGAYPLLSMMEQQNETFRTFIAALRMEGAAGKLKLAEGLGLLTESQIAFIRAVSRVRHRYAHNVKNMHRSLTDILAEEQRHDARIVERLIGIKFALSPAANDFVKLLMYHRLADCLGEALQVLRPPPLPEGGLLGHLLATPPPSSASAPAPDSG